MLGPEQSRETKLNGTGCIEVCRSIPMRPVAIPVAKAATSIAPDDPLQTVSGLVG